MGQSTDAYLFYGFEFHDAESGDDGMWYDDADTVLGGENDWEHEYAIRKGAPKPAVPYEQDKEAHQNFGTASRKATEASGCTIDSHCSGDYPVYFVCIRESYLSAWRGNPTEVPEGHTIPPVEWADLLHDFCVTMGIEWRDPKWLLASYWG